MEGDAAGLSGPESTLAEAFFCTEAPEDKTWLRLLLPDDLQLGKASAQTIAAIIMPEVLTNFISWKNMCLIKNVTRVNAKLSRLYWSRRLTVTFNIA